MLTREEMGKKLEIARTERKMSQLWLGQEVGLSQGMIGRYERGVNRIPPDVLQKVAEILQKPVSYFYGEDAPSEEIREFLTDFVKEKKIAGGLIQVSVPLLEEIYPGNITQQIALAQQHISVSPTLANERNSCFAIKTTSLSTIDLDVSIDTLLVVSTRIPPINGDKVLVFQGNELMLRTYYKKDGAITFRSANPLFSTPVKQNDDTLFVGVVISSEKRG